MLGLGIGWGIGQPEVLGRWPFFNSTQGSYNIFFRFQDLFQDLLKDSNYHVSKLFFYMTFLSKPSFLILLIFSRLKRPLFFFWSARTTHRSEIQGQGYMSQLAKFKLFQDLENAWKFWYLSLCVPSHSKTLTSLLGRNPLIGLDKMQKEWWWVAGDDNVYTLFVKSWLLALLFQWPSMSN